MTKLSYNIEKRLANTVIARKNNIKVVEKSFVGQVGKEAIQDQEIEM